MQNAEQLFNENIQSTKSLIYYRPTKSWNWGGLKLSADDLIKELEVQGLTMSQRTLQRWSKAEMIPEPSRGSYGQGGGTYADYPAETLSEILAAQILKKVYRFKNREVAEARRKAHKGDLFNWRAMLWIDLKETFTEIDGDPPVDYALVKEASTTAYEAGLFPAVGGIMRQVLVNAGINQSDLEALGFSLPEE